MNPSSVDLFLDGFPNWVGDRTVGVVGFDLIVHERIDQIFLPQVLEEILLAPTLEHAVSNNDRPQVPAARHDWRLMTSLRQPSHLAESKLPLQKAHGLVMETVSHLPTVQPCPVPSEPFSSDVAGAPLAIGQDVKAHGQQILKQFGTPAAAVKDNGGVPVRSQEFAYFAQHRREHPGHTGVGIGGDHEQGIAALIVDPIIGACGCGEMHAGHIGLRNRVFAVVGPNMAVNIEEPQHLSTLGDALPRDLTTELIAALQ